MESQSNSQTEKFVQAVPKYKIGTVVKYYDPNRKGISHYGEIVLIQITRKGIVYQTQDHVALTEENIKSEFYEMPF